MGNIPHSERCSRHPSFRSSSTMSAVNYARFDGIFKSELPGAIVMAAIYAPLFLLNVFRSIRHPTYVLIVLAFFCSSKLRRHSIHLLESDRLYL